MQTIDDETALFLGLDDFLSFEDLQVVGNVCNFLPQLRGDLADRVAAATDHERAEQERLRRTADFAEGTRAMAERRPPKFTGVE